MTPERAPLLRLMFHATRKWTRVAMFLLPNRLFGPFFVLFFSYRNRDNDALSLPFLRILRMPSQGFFASRVNVVSLARARIAASDEARHQR
jgi:hypothetical protein